MTFLFFINYAFGIYILQGTNTTITLFNKYVRANIKVHLHFHIYLFMLIGMSLDNIMYTYYYNMIYNIMYILGSGA